MKILEFLFALLKQFIQFEPGRYAQLKEQSAAWEIEQKEKGGFFANILQKSEAWYVQVGMMVIFMFAVKYISNWMMSDGSPSVLENYQEDEEEEEDMPIRTPQKFKFG